MLAVLAAGAVAVSGRRRRRVRGVARITPAELRALIESGEPVTIVDLRSVIQVERSGAKIPGALVMHPAEAELHLRGTPRDHHLVFYCACPNEASSARLALKLSQLGFDSVRPLEGGFDAWRNQGYPVDAIPKEGTY